MVNQAFIIIIAYRPRRRRRRKIPGIGRYPMGPTKKYLKYLPAQDSLSPGCAHLIVRSDSEIE